MIWPLEPPSLPFLCVSVCLCVCPSCRLAQMPGSSLELFTHWRTFSSELSDSSPGLSLNSTFICHSCRCQGRQSCCLSPASPFPSHTVTCFSHRRDILQHKWKIGKFDLFSPHFTCLKLFFCIFAHIRPATVDSFSPVWFNKWNICANSSSTSVISFLVKKKKSAAEGFSH